jgi:hypothetical protein
MSQTSAPLRPHVVNCENAESGVRDVRVTNPQFHVYDELPGRGTSYVAKGVNGA